MSVNRPVESAKKLATTPVKLKKTVTIVGRAVKAFDLSWSFQFFALKNFRAERVTRRFAVIVTSSFKAMLNKSPTGA